MTQAVKRTPADVLREARRRDSHRKRDQVYRMLGSPRDETEESSLCPSGSDWSVVSGPA